MSRFIKKKKEDIGLSPYALVFRGLKKKLKEIKMAIVKKVVTRKKVDEESMADALKTLKNDFSGEMLCSKN